MDLEKKLEKLGIEEVKRLDNTAIRNIAINVTETLTKAFPIIYEEYNNILAKMLNCSMYTAKVTKPISKVNYIYENNSIYFDESVNLDTMNEQIMHESIHYLQDYRNIKGKLEKIGLCSFGEFAVYGLGLNEAAVEYISAKSLGNSLSIVTKYDIRLKTCSPNYYPFLTNLIEQIVYLMGEEKLVKGTINGTEEFIDYLLNTFEGNTRKIVARFDELIEINNSLTLEYDLEKRKTLQVGLGSIYLETQNEIFKTFFDKITPRLTTIQEVDLYTKKALEYKNLMGVNLEDRFKEDDYYSVHIYDITNNLNKKLMDINKEKSKNALSVIRFDWLSKLIRKINALFSS